MSAHLLARLTAHGVNITGEGFGGIPSITNSDVAGAMSGMAKDVYELMLLKYCADHTMYSPVADRIRLKLMRQAMMGDLPTDKVKRVALLIVDQVVRGPVCPSCNGTGVKITESKACDCVPCGGTGKQQMNQTNAAKFIDVPRETYRRKYAAVVSDHVANLEALESEGFSHLRRKFS